MSSSSSSLTAPPEGTATEQYHPARPTPTATAFTGTAERLVQYHARARSFTSDAPEDEDTLTMPVPKRSSHTEHGVLSPSRPSSRGSQAAASSALSHSSGPQLQPQQRATGIVDSSGFHYTTRSAPAPPARLTAEAPQRRSSPSTTGHVKEAAAPVPDPAVTGLLLPAPYDTPPSPDARDAAAAASGPVRSTAQWQLTSPAERSGRQPGGGSTSATSGRTTALQSVAAASMRGAVFEYASEAVNTLEQQYGDALQRLGTMHRLYDRLDAHNHTLEAEVQRVRHVSDVLHNGVAFQLYNSVRQVRREMKLLKQYVELLCAGFENQLQALQQVVAEEVPRLLGRRDPYTSLLPYGAEGRLRAADTRVSVGAHYGCGGGGWDPVAHSARPALRRGGSPGPDTAEASVCRPDHWWNAVSPHPMRGPSPLAAADDAEEHQLNAAEGAPQQRAPLLQLEGGAGTSDGAADQPPYRDYATSQQLEDALVSRQAYREVQAALAAAQRRVVELERDAATHEAACESRIAKLKAAHRAKQATLQDELTLLRRRSEAAAAELGHLSQHQQLLALATAAGAEGSGSGGEGGGSRGPVVPIDVKQLAQLLLELHGGSAAAAGGARDTHRSEVEVEDRGEASLKRSHRREAPAPSRCSPRGAAGGVASTLLVSSPSASATASASDTLDATDEEDVYDADDRDGSDADSGPADVRQSFDRTNRRVVRAVLQRGNASGTRDGALHRPDSYSPSAAAHRAERAREVLGRGASTSARQPRTQSPGRVGSVSGGPTPRSLAYDRLVDRKHPFPASALRGGGCAARSGGSAARLHHRVDDDHPSRGDARSHSGARGGVDPALLQSLLAQLAALGTDNRRSHNGPGTAIAAAAADGGGSRRLRAAPRPRDVEVDRVAQGLWAEELLKERHYL